MSTTSPPWDSVARRTLRFASLDDVLAEARRLMEAAQAGRLSYAGRWTLARMLNHLAVWMEYAYTEAPLKVPFFMRWLLRPMKRRMLTTSMKSGLRLPKVQGGTLGIEDVPLEQAVRRFEAALGRLKSEPPTRAHPLFGRMTHDEWIALHLRHAELHLSFAVPA